MQIDGGVEMHWSGIRVKGTGAKNELSLTKSLVSAVKHTLNCRNVGTNEALQISLNRTRVVRVSKVENQTWTPDVS